MALGDLAGRARVSLRSPQAQGECDRCGCWYLLSRLTRQFEWRGAALADTGFLVCPRCLDRPNEQNRVIILPLDPVPRVNPRPSRDTTAPWYGGGSPPTSPQNQGFTVYILGGAIPGLYPTTKSGVLSDVALMSGVPVPVDVMDYGTALPQGQSVQLFGANPARQWMLLYNPTQYVVEFALGSAVWNGLLNLSIGPGEAFFWATAQGLQPVWLGAVSAIGLYGDNLPLWCWTDGTGLLDDDGVLQLINGMGWPTSPLGLPPGAVWNNGLAVGVVPGVTPDPAAPPVFFGTVYAYQLLALGGGDLPLINPTLGLGQLWNDGGQVAVDDMAMSSGLANNGATLLLLVPSSPTGAFTFGVSGFGDAAFGAGLPAGNGWPTAPTGLAPGALWNDDGLVAVVPGAVPNPDAPPLIFGTLNAAQLLAIGGANLPLSPIGLVLNQLWNDEGVVAIAL